jgi:uncharacterized membrane protein YkoI
MRLAIKVLLVAVGVVFLIAGRPSPRTAAVPYDSDVTRAGFVTANAQASDRDQPGPDEEKSAAEQQGRDDTPVTGTPAEQAKAAAQAAVSGATVRGVERETNDDDTPRSAFEVELVRPNGTTVEVELDADYKVLTTDQDDDSRDDD